MSPVRLIVTGGFGDAAALRAQLSMIPAGPWEIRAVGNTRQNDAAPDVRVVDSERDTAQFRVGCADWSGSVVWFPAGRRLRPGGIEALARTIHVGQAAMVVGAPGDIGGRGAAVPLPDLRSVFGAPIDLEVCALSASLLGALPPADEVGEGLAGAAAALAALAGGLVLWDRPVADRGAPRACDDEERRLAAAARHAVSALDVLNSAPPSPRRDRDLPFLMSLVVSRFAPVARERNRRVLAGLRPVWTRD